MSCKPHAVISLGQILSKIWSRGEGVISGDPLSGVLTNCDDSNMIKLDFRPVMFLQLSY